MTPTDYEVERHTYERYRDRYQQYETYWDGNANSLITFYDVAAQVDEAEQIDYSEAEQPDIPRSSMPWYLTDAQLDAMADSVDERNAMATAASQGVL